jgi:hypothetical protein
MDVPNRLLVRTSNLDSLGHLALGPIKKVDDELAVTLQERLEHRLSDKISDLATVTDRLATDFVLFEKFDQTSPGSPAFAQTFGIARLTRLELMFNGGLTVPNFPAFSLFSRDLGGGSHRRLTLPIGG